MDSLLHYFAHMPTSHRAATIATGFLFVWALELSFGASQFRRYRHARTNLVFWASTLLVNLAFTGVTLATSFAVSEARFGLLHLFAMPSWLDLLLSIALMDLIVAYVHHRLSHGVPFLWKFHVVHHSDVHVDSTTALRHSPVEALMRAIMTLIGVTVLGVSPGALVAYQAMALLSAQWIHSDIHLPGWVDRLLSSVLVSPGMHRAHHHRSLPWTDTNYGTIFSLWDRLFGTRSSLATQSVRFGIDVIPESAEREESTLRVVRLALLPAKEGYRPRATAGTTTVAQAL